MLFPHRCVEPAAGEIILWEGGGDNDREMIRNLVLD